jgi:hypothetical protein
MNVTFDKRQSATILAALRYWQREGLMSSGHEQDIATDGNSIDALDAEDIDALCEQINVPAATPIIVVGCEGGLVQGASSNIEGLSMIVLDYDTEGCDDDEITEVPQSDTVELESAIVGLHTVAHDTPWIQQIVTAAGLKDTTGKPLELAAGAAQDSGNCRALLESVHEELEGMGFGTDQSIDGGDCCEYLGKLFVDVGEALERDGAKVTA